MPENRSAKKCIASKERRCINFEDDDTVEFGDPTSDGEMFGVYNDENSRDSGICNTDDEECARRQDFTGEKNAPRLERRCINFEDVDCVSLGSLFTPTSKVFGMDDDENSRDRDISETHSKKFTIGQDSIGKQKQSCMERRCINFEDDDTVEFGDPTSDGEMFGVYNDENSRDSGICNTDDEECARRQDFTGEKNAPRLERRCINFEDVDCVSLGSLFTPTSKVFGMDDDENSRDRDISETHSKKFTIGQDSIGKQKQSCMNGKNQYSQRFLMRKSKSFKSRKCLSKSLACDLDASISKRNQLREVNHRHIMNVVDTLAEGEDLVGDGSAAHQLPTIPGKHKDLKSVSSQTVKDVIEGAYKVVIDSYVIVDCRYPYEYDGGHIEGAENLYTRDMVVERFLSNVNSSEKTVVIFHCEFSSERGPKLLRHLRSMDRQVNAENYPRLHYPEIYLLHGGYKEFFQHEKEFCVPQQYRPMLDKEHSADLRHFRAKSKSWQAGERRKCLRF